MFVFLGRRLPRYAAANIRMASRSAGLPVVLLTDADTAGHDLGPASVIRVDASWYQTDRIEEFRTRSGLDPAFRDGFWLAAAERFFVLAAAMQNLGYSRVLHAECDVMLFDVSDVPERLDQEGPSLYFPHPYRDWLVASFCYFNAAHELASVCDWIVEHADQRNEMALLADFARSNPQAVTFLPTDGVFAPPSRDWRASVRTLLPEQLGGILDANALGQWLLGIDPRNHFGPSWNHFANENAEHPLAALRFALGPDGASMRVAVDHSEEHQVLCLHVHAKVHERLERSDLLRRAVKDTSEGRRTLIYRGVPSTVRPGRTLLPSRFASVIRRRRFRNL